MPGAGHKPDHRIWSDCGDGARVCRGSIRIFLAMNQKQGSVHQSPIFRATERVSVSVRGCEKTKHRLGSLCHGSHSSQIARAFALSFGGNSECSLWGDGARVPLPLAIYANTTICEALDGDDGYNFVKGHPGAFLLPATLAFAERGCLDGTGHSRR